MRLGQPIRACYSGGIRYLSTSTSAYSLTCGLEIHAQLMTDLKLFSCSKTSFHARPNSNVSFYDAGLPGTLPKFNPQALLLALKASSALNCKVRDCFSFDRKHYFYGDQPVGYQVTQHYQPYAHDGVLKLYERDGVKKDVSVRIKQIQIEQDTGKSTYIDDIAHVDLNRTNHGLIELVTEPDIPTPEAAGVFVKKLQMLLRHIGVCSGELETGAMRVDVNISVNNGQRCEIKNLSSTSAIVAAIKAEFRRQRKIIESGGTVESETRGWDGTNTWKLRGKEEGVDYRYMPDPELQPIRISEDTLNHVKSTLPELPDSIFQRLLEPPYSIPLKDARTIMSVSGMAAYYEQVYNYLQSHDSPKPGAASNWLVHRLYGELNVQEKEFNPDLFPPEVLGNIILMVQKDRLTATSATLLIRHLISNPLDSNASIETVIEDLDLTKAQDTNSEVQEAIQGLCEQVIEQNPVVADQVRSGKKPKSLMFLVGQVMRECQGRVDANTVKTHLSKILNN
ncbi:hypothetical protein TRICI_006099 [Trichomonascus ciferrii]|uniref:Glutamyl-tRNA(Gln) amidotransferase subunit B, mitochondrial n=1 Tax=Trichomonascus ciferrii TaxID=44093 RepID=A0A642UNJ7_9ASCO|nr:hypothetical protein TRICI_006099 [Trichomonascus ciferrii]